MVDPGECSGSAIGGIRWNVPVPHSLCRLGTPELLRLRPGLNILADRRAILLR
jgi:hypothetical protein